MAANFVHPTMVRDGGLWFFRAMMSDYVEDDHGNLRIWS